MEFFPLLVYAAITKAVFKRVPYYSFFDGYPFLYENPETNQKAFICVSEKVGSSAWKALLLKSFDENFFATFVNSTKIDPHAAQFRNNKTEKTTKAMYEAALKDSSIPRIMLVRNPYSRILSGYLDKVDAANFTANPLQRRQFFKGFKSKSGGFPAFAKYVKEVHERDIHPNNTKRAFLNDHYALQSDKCFIPQGMRFDYYLKIEHISLWYPFLISLLGLQKAASSGWNFTTSWRPAAINNSNKNASDLHRVLSPSPQSCFYTAPGQSCEDVANDFRRLGQADFCPENMKQQGKKRNGLSPLTVEDITDEDTFIGRSISSMSFFYTESVAKDITDFARKDLAMFNYPVWNGTDIQTFAEGCVATATVANCSTIDQFAMYS